MAIPGNANLLLLTEAAGAAPTGYTIDRSVRLNPADTAFFSKTFGSAGNRRTYTLSAWIKLCSVATSQYYLMASGNTYFCFTSTGQIEVNLRSGSTNYFSTSNQVFRDFSAWQHIVWVVNTASSAMEAYVNGVRITWSSRNIPGNTDTDINRAAAHNLGKSTLDPRYFDGYLAEVHFLDGITPGTTTREVGGVTQTILTDFGEFDETTGVWNPIEYTGNYGTNGFHLDFADNSSTTSGSNVGIGKDVSGNGNYFNSNNISVTAGAGNDSLRDSPTNGNTANDTGAGGEVPGNYCTLNSLDKDSSATLSNGNLDLTASTAYQNAKGTIGIPVSDKWYFEVAASTTTGTTSAVNVGLATSSAVLNAGYLGGSGIYMLNAVNALRFYNQTTEFTASGDVAAGEIVQIAYDASNGKAWVGIDNTWYDSSAGTTGDPGAGTNETFSIPSVTMFPYIGGYQNTVYANFGQRAFAYSAPSGFKALCTANLDDPTIADGSAYMDVVTYTGLGGTQIISGLEFSPDFVWIKSRSNSINHALFDVVRGVNKTMISSSTSSEETSNIYGAVSSFNTYGFTVQNGSTDANRTNENTYTYVAWTWDAGGNSNIFNVDGTGYSTTSAAGITEGTVSLTGASVNRSARFSIVTATGSSASTATVGHGLDVSPELIIVKLRVTAGNGFDQDWQVYHKSIGNTGGLKLNTTDSTETSSNIWNNTSPTSTVFSIGASSRYDGNFVAYCFAPVAGYSAFGSYTGTGSATDSPFIYTGMKVKWLMVKRTDSAEPWWMWDIPRSTATPGNPMDALLRANGSDQEYAPDTAVDSLSNGFKPRSSSSNVNASGATYIYAAFAENPFKYARAR